MRAGVHCSRMSGRHEYRPSRVSRLDARLALRVDQDGCARRAGRLYTMLVPTEVVRDVPVVESCSRGHVCTPLNILRINGAGRIATHIRPHYGARGCADASRNVSPAATANLMAKDAADDASRYSARDIDTGRAGVHSLTLDPAALLRWSHHGTHRGDRRLVQRLALSATVVIRGWRDSRKTLCVFGPPLRFRRLYLCCRGLLLRHVGTDTRIRCRALRGERGLLATKARHVLRRRGTLARK